MDEGITEEQAEQLLRGLQDEKLTIPAFFSKVIENDDTTRTGNLDETELGLSNYPVRTYKELEVFCRDVCSNDSWGDYFKKMAEIQTSTSLSKNAILLKLLVTKKNEVADTTPQRRKENKSWFKKKESEPQSQI